MPSLDSVTTSRRPEDLIARGLPAGEVFGSVSIDLRDGRTVHYGGLATELPVRVGQKVRRGEVIGRSGYFKVVFDTPHICVSMGRHGRPTDIGVLWFGKDYVSKDYLIKKPAPYDPSRRYPVKGLREDLQLVRGALEEGHPGLYAYSDKVTMDRLFDQTLAQLDRDLTDDEFVAMLRKLVRAVRCNHTVVFRSLEFEEAPRQILPFEVRFHEGKAFVIHDNSPKPTLEPGTEVLEIDGHSVAEVRESVAALFNPDGFNTSYPDLMSEQYLFLRYAELFGSRASVKVTTRRSSGATEVHNVPTLTRAQLMEQRKKNPKAPGKRTFGVRILDARSALLTVPGFDGLDEVALRDAFRELQEKHVANLIVDLRNNPGGSAETMAAVYAYLASGPFKIEEYQRANRDGAFRFFAFTNNWRAGMKLEGAFEKDPGRGCYIKAAQQFQPAQAFGYSGKVVVLANGRTLSAAGLLAALLQRNNRATLIGTEAGGGYYLLNGISFADLQLRTAPLVVHLPLIQCVLTQQRDPRVAWGHGVAPDFLVPPVLQDQIEQRDTILLRAQERLAASGS